MTSATPWFVQLNACSAPTLRLFCCHHAGGNASQFRSWSELFADAAELIGIQLPGRRERLVEAPVTSVTEAAAAIAAEIARHCLDTPIVLFGQSLGAYIAYEVAAVLEHQYSVTPAYLIVACAKAPHLQRRLEPISELPDLEFIARLRTYGGTEDEILSDTDLMLLLCPTLKADFRMVELYRPPQRPPLGCPVMAAGGAEDPYVSEADLAAWELTTQAAFTRLVLAGGHFLTHSSQRLLVREIRSGLSAHQAASASHSRQAQCEDRAEASATSRTQIGNVL